MNVLITYYLNWTEYNWTYSAHSLLLQLKLSLCYSQTTNQQKQKAKVSWMVSNKRISKENLIGPRKFALKNDLSFFSSNKSWLEIWSQRSHRKIFPQVDLWTRKWVWSSKNPLFLSSLFACFLSLFFLFLFLSLFLSFSLSFFLPFFFLPFFFLSFFSFFLS